MNKDVSPYVKHLFEQFYVFDDIRKSAEKNNADRNTSYSELQKIFSDFTSAFT